MSTGKRTAVFIILLAAATLLACGGDTTTTESTETATQAPTQVRTTATPARAVERTEDQTGERTGNEAERTQTAPRRPGRTGPAPGTPESAAHTPAPQGDAAKTPEATRDPNAPRLSPEPGMAIGSPKRIPDTRLSEEDATCLPDEITTRGAVLEYIRRGIDEHADLMTCLSGPGQVALNLITESEVDARFEYQKCTREASIASTKLGGGGYTLRFYEPMTELRMLNIAKWAYCTRDEEFLPVNGYGHYREQLEIRDVLICLVDQEEDLGQFVNRYGNFDNILETVAEARRGEGPCAQGG